MREAYLEHTNITVSEPDALASILCQIFDWEIRWSGEAMNQGFTIHVGGKDSYLAIYTNADVKLSSKNDVQTIRNLNHLGIVVDNLEQAEQRVIAQGYTPFNHRQYLKGHKCFYFHTLDSIEIEVICYNE